MDNELVIKPSPIQKQFLEATQHIVFFGGGAGGGKSWAILVDNLQGVNDPRYLSVMFRNTTTELEMDLWPKAKAMYTPLITDKNGKFLGKANIREDRKEIMFPSGARTKFAYLELDKHGDSHYGAEYARIYYDEFQKLSEYNFHTTRSRNRSMADVPKGLRCTLNPDPEHFVYNWIKPFLNEEGFPDKSICGRTRYYLIYRGVLHTDWEPENLRKQFKKNPQTYTYIPSLLEDNQIVLEANPDYADMLDSMPERKRKQLLLGCWKLDDDSGVMWKRSWLIGENGERCLSREDIPKGGVCYRGIDKAYMSPHDKYRYPDYTAISPKIYKTQDGLYILVGDYHEGVIDERSPWDSEEPIIGRVRKLPGARDEDILRQAIHDGRECIYVLTKDNGGAVSDYMNTVSKLISVGVKVKTDSSAKTTRDKKIKDFEDFSSACENGLVFIAKDTFPPETLEYIFKELETFDGSRSGTTRKDDFVDAISMAFNEIKTANTARFSPRNQLKMRSLSADRLARINPLS